MSRWTIGGKQSWCKQAIFILLVSSYLALALGNVNSWLIRGSQSLQDVTQQNYGDKEIFYHISRSFRREMELMVLYQ
ncbi:hypothetical protein WN943_015876 [Citrus x changshan-huyou]